MTHADERAEGGGGGDRGGGERWAVVFDYNKMLHLVSLILQLNGKKHREDC